MFHRQFLTISTLIFCFSSLTFGQIPQNQANVRPLPRPLINIQCGRSSILRTTGLIPPANQQIPQTCTYTIIASSFFVCQMRIDFRRLTLPPPTVVGDYAECNDGHLQVQVGNSQDGYLQFKYCGENADQHIYVPVNPINIAQRSVQISIVSTNGNGNARDWLIEVNQLDCPLGQHRSIDNVRYNAMNPSAFNASELQRPIRTGKSIVSDWLAPPGCLQFHAQPEGTIKSFNFNGAQGLYMGNMNYAICFRRTRQNREIQLTTNFFQMGMTTPINPPVPPVNGQGTATGEGFDLDCFQREDPTIGRSEDYLFIPSAVVVIPRTDDPLARRTVRATRFCGAGLASAIGPLVSSPPGPFQMIFNSDNIYNGNELGFSFQYRIV